MEISINTDGGSRGNPGKSGLGVVVKDSLGVVLAQKSRFLGIKTNNEAEYLAVIESLEWVLSTKIQITRITWKLDSMLVVEQLNRHWKIKEVRLQELAQRCFGLLQKLTIPYSFTYIPRAANAEADLLANQAMDLGETS